MEKSWAFVQHKRGETDEENDSNPEIVERGPVSEDPKVKSGHDLRTACVHT